MFFQIFAKKMIFQNLAKIDDFFQIMAKNDDFFITW